MRRKLNLLFILVLGIILVMALAACNAQAQDVSKLPEEVNPGNVSSPNLDLAKADTYLTFTFTKRMSSVLSAIFVDEFDISDVHYNIVYTDGNTTTVVNGGELTLDMLDEDDRPLVSQAGHHMIHASTVVESGKTATGSFALHLKDRSAQISLVTLTFNLKNSQTGEVAHAYFGSSDRERGIVTIQVEKGSYFASWDEFVRTYRMALDGKALSKVTYSGGELSATSGFDNGFEITKDMSFVTVWADDTIKISFDLAVPTDATLVYGAEDPRPDFVNNGAKAYQYVERSVGRAVAPVIDEFNVFNGYYFAGWFVNDGDGNPDNDVIWNFSHTVGSVDINLYAKWTRRTYSFTLYTMGGVYPTNVQNSIVNGVSVSSEEIANNLGYRVVNSSSRFSLGAGEINRVVVSGLIYGESYKNYVIRVTVSNDPERTVLMTFDDLVSNLRKGAGDYVKAAGLYAEYQCKHAVSLDRVVVDEDGDLDDIGYVKWVFNEPDRNDYELEANYRIARLEKLSKYMREVVFKDGITVKNDGTLRLEKVADETINVLIIPATIYYEGEERRITEIAPKAANELKALVTLDASEAKYLLVVGDEAFAHCPSLEEVILPVENNVEKLGRAVLYNTYFERNYTQLRKGLQFIIFKDILLNYVGPTNPAQKDLDLSVDFYTEENTPLLTAEERARANETLANVKTIAPGAFDGWKTLETIKLNDNIENVTDYSFADLAHFKGMEVNSTSRLKYVGEYAFDNTPLMLTTSSNNYNTTYKAIVIGDVYFRFLGKNDKVAAIPANIKYISPRAFLNCGNLQTITFLNEGRIVSIGKDVFFNTLWIRNDNGTTVNNGFVVVNNILAEYYNERFDADNVNIELPSNVKYVGSHAFNSYAQHVRTIQFGTSVLNIEEYAFIGASALRSLIFTEVTAENNRLVGAPDINERSFSDYNGNIINSVKFFFRESVLDVLERLATNLNDIDRIEDSVTRHWAQFYYTNKSLFIAEDISAVWIDPNVISTALMRTGATGNAYTDRYGLGSVDNALIVVSNTGITRHDALDRIENNLQFVDVTPNGEYSAYYEEGVYKRVLTFTYHNETKGCAIHSGDENLFVLTVYHAIKGVPNFTSSTVYPTYPTPVIANGLNESNSDYWFEHADGELFDGQVAGAEIPTFYTSYGALDIVFAYKDINDVVHRLPVRVSDFSTNIERTSVAHLAVDFYGLGTYRFTLNYSVVESKFIAIRQSMAVSIPLNGATAYYFARFAVDLVGQDGHAVSAPLTVGNFTVVKVDGQPSSVATSKSLGTHTVTIRYTKSDAAEPLEQDILYTVIFDADISQFSFEVISEMAGTARLVSCHSSLKSADTIVVPGLCTIDGKEYRVIEIGGASGETQGVFQDFTSLKAVYLSNLIQRIGVHSFKGCTLLEHVYTAVIAGGDPTHLTKENFRDVRIVSESSTRVVKEVLLDNLVGAEFMVSPFTGQAVLVVGDTYRFTDERGREVICKIVKANNNISVDAENVLVYMPDTIFNEYKLFESTTDNRIYPLVYSSASGLRIRTENSVYQTITHIGYGAFSECYSLKDIDLTKAVNLEDIGVGAFSYTALESIDISNCTKVIELNNQVFRFCEQMKFVKMHDGIQVIGANAFNACKNLENIIVVHHNGDGSKSERVNVLSCNTLAYDAFNQCTSLTEITLTSSVANIQSHAFSACSALTIYCEILQSNMPSTWLTRWSGSSPVVWNCNYNKRAEDGLYYIMVDGIRYSYDTVSGTATVAKQASCIKTAVIPSTIVGYDGNTYTVTTIGNSAFEGTGLVEITISSSITTIAEHAFSNCVDLVAFNFSDSNNLQTINSTAFSGCVNLTPPPDIVELT